MMRIIFFSHPEFVESESMPRLLKMIAGGMLARGHSIDTWVPRAIFYRLPFGHRLRKWLGYIDQFIVFPLQLRWRVRKVPVDTIFVFPDQALGPWVPLVANRPHLVHINDLLAVRSAVGELPQNPTTWTGKQYQAMILRGLSCGRFFISISEKTRSDLHRFIPCKPAISEVVYLGLNFPFHHMSESSAAVSFAEINLDIPTCGFLLHVGGNQWYKNRQGVIEIYQAYARATVNPLPLLMVGAMPNEILIDLVQRFPNEGVVIFLTGLSNTQVCALYSTARLLLFPSLAEGFGWPIAEAMACGCLVLTTNEAPMTEVGGSAAFYVPPRPVRDPDIWAEQAGSYVSEILALSPVQVNGRQNLGYLQSAKFDVEQTIDVYECIYEEVLDLVSSR